MAISAAILGTAGMFHAQYVLFVDPFSVLGLHLSVLVALFAILGGSGHLVRPDPGGGHPRAAVGVFCASPSREAAAMSIC